MVLQTFTGRGLSMLSRRTGEPGQILLAGRLPSSELRRRRAAGFQVQHGTLLGLRRIHGTGVLHDLEQVPMYSLTSQTLPAPRGTALFFPGQGTQRVSMLSYLLRTFPSTIAPLVELLDHTIATSDLTFPPITSSQSPTSPTTPLSSIITNGPAPLLTATENAQPSILFTSLCYLAVLEKDFGFDLCKLGRREGDKQIYFLGHSLGEFSALVAAGVMKLEDAITIVRRRGIAMARSVPEQDRNDVGMFALLSPAEHLPDLIETINHAITPVEPGNSDNSGLLNLPQGKIVQIANHNTAGQIVLSGHISAIHLLLNHLRKFSGHDPRPLRLNVSAPFHSTLMMPAVEVVEQELSGMKLDWEGRRGEVVSNVTAREYVSEAELREILPRQAVEKVRWADSVSWLGKEKGVVRWVGFGPEVKVGRGLVKKNVDRDVVMVGEGMTGKEWEDVARLYLNEDLGWSCLVR
ncbi:acyl transferase/acyl hydrolase/lysophospholipase [Kalaharituber pfeilii]|nr:acyl transferase/acyl hydrolase/lysophospholipase [Kalaharituber pfeilii]